MTEEVKISGRRQRRLEKEQDQTAEPKKTYWVQIRMFPIWLRILLCIMLFAAAAAAGLMVGYGFLGDGKPTDALKWETYQHILDIKDGK
ncbi:DNA-directed RNA polymerase subunit beta [Psychrobacillus sp. NEAU-3TGS]|uniref:DNA-directed RNA polymerase subunit beta n=1 Tax=Psychrobacillus sp. NEAU-3TGS TaxID=2995412 RepID=UPI0024979ED7|nr:DNA-directed RNA polymerase subunit beta [Psychrobacillus sp. NEAU-3TGS]MDI2587735.1 DNA-directed RNA polymerase subunit beta [Psychrobacillus sp. NEAU-3TGS]